jgi:hypothetical protein
MESPTRFASVHFAGLPLGDPRRSRRAVAIASDLAADPAASIPRSAGDWCRTKAAYRFFRADSVTPDSVTSTHRSLVLAEARSRRVVLFLQDTTEIGYGTPGVRTGLGPIGHGHQADGLLMHTTLAVDPAADRAVLGVACLKVWARDGVRPHEAQRVRRARGDRESLKWATSVREVGAPPAGSRWIHVADREGDVWETFDACVSTGSDCVVRACGAAARRKAALAVGGPAAREDACELRDLARSLRPGASCRVERQGAAGGVAISVSFAEVTLFAPGQLPRSTEPLRMWVVRAWEKDKDPSRDAEALEWVLLTTVPVRDAKEALEAVRWYARRWTIEDYHKCLKTGCRVDSRQLESGERLAPLCAMLAVIAAYVMSLKSVATVRPEAPATEAAPRAYVEAMSKLRGIPMEDLTAYRFRREVARLGGFLARKSDGEPGWQTLWHGWRDLELIVTGASLRGEGRCG